jgi:putative (di)nucleoside polyphosphate hydrolase
MNSVLLAMQPSPSLPVHLTSLPYRTGVGMMVLNAQNQVFVAKRIDPISEAWQMPQGGMDAGESPLIAALRELQEEVGTDKFEVIRESADWYTYDLPDDLVGKIWDGQYRGQKQKWFALRFTGEDSDINIATEHPEFCEWKWIEMRALPDIIVPFKRELYRALIEEFKGAIAPAQ